MKNEKGITLVELIAVMAIAGIIIALMASVLTSGTNASQRTSLNQQLQQEGNIIVEKIRAQYLLNHKDASIVNEFKVKVENDKLILYDGVADSERLVISEGFEYALYPPGTDPSVDPSAMIESIQLNRTQKSDFFLIIRGKSNMNSDVQEYRIETSFSKLY